MLKRNCPQCGDEIVYKRKDNYESAIRDNNWCKKCSAMPTTRSCPQCGDVLTYVNRYNCLKAERKNQVCVKCEAEKRKVRYLGENNPFFGKTHTLETKKIISLQDRSFAHTEAFRQRRRETSKYGSENPMYGKSIYELSVRKYGKHEADRRFAETKKKWSHNASGENNPMFGKPSPQGSGNGWKGWYKNWFFRSLRELSYMINVIEKDKHEWQTAETKKLSIPYIDPNGVSRTYRADFLLDKKTLVEVKPTKLKSSRTVRAKEAAAKRFCEEQGWEYRLVDPPKLTDAEIKHLHQTGQIKFMDRYEILYQGRYLNAGIADRDGGVGEKHMG